MKASYLEKHFIVLGKRSLNSAPNQEEAGALCSAALAGLIWEGGSLMQRTELRVARVARVSAPLVPSGFASGEKYK